MIVFPPGYELREPTVDDAAALAESLDRNREHMAPWDPVRPESFYTVDGQRAALERALVDRQAGTRAAWLLFHRFRVVGGLSFNQIVRLHLQSAVLGYWVDRDHVRLGLATAMAEYALERAGEMGLHRVEAGTHVDNLASQAVLERAGFERYGLAPRMLWVGGGWADHVLFQVLLHDDPPVA